jgi:hypothetical protein
VTFLFSCLMCSLIRPLITRGKLAREEGDEESTMKVEGTSCLSISRLIALTLRRPQVLRTLFLEFNFTSLISVTEQS